jgi:hypothetical protein
MKLLISLLILSLLLDLSCLMIGLNWNYVVLINVLVGAGLGYVHAIYTLTNRNRSNLVQGKFKLVPVEMNPKKQVK